jgi:NAD-dependent dihydropyrimidine dehydrogenase PreA subunit
MIAFFDSPDCPHWSDEAGLELTAGLLASERPCRICGDLPRLARDADASLADIATTDDLRIVSPLYPRAVTWLFHAAGVDLPHGTPCMTTQGRQPEDILEELLACRPTVTDQHRRQARQLRQAAACDNDWRPWFPVIDYDRCTACGQCAAFCIFGVYTHQPDRVLVTRPANCKNNCPACARVCPAGAIIFPKHTAAPINADDTAAPGPDVLPGFGDLRDPHVMDKLRARAAAARQAAEEKRKHMENE